MLKSEQEKIKHLTLTLSLLLGLATSVGADNTYDNSEQDWNEAKLSLDNDDIPF